MKLWGTIWGGLIGLSITASDEFGSIFGLFFGAFLGFLAGVWLEGSARNIAKTTLKQIVDAELKDYIAREIEKALDGRVASERPAAPAQAPPPVAAEPQPVPAPLPEPVPATRAKTQPAPVERAPVPEPAPEPATPFVSEPNAIDHAVAAIREWFMGGNTIVRAGLVILFVGLVFLARYAAQAGLFPIEMRLALVGAAGAALIGVGFNRRIKRPEFGLALQGAGVAVMYLTVFAAASTALDFQILAPTVGFALMIVIAALGCALALLQDSKAMALASMLGGYAVPVLLGGESPTPLPLFAYLTVLNLAVLVIAWRRSWRSLNLLGFFATVLIVSAWTARYEPQHFMVCQVMLAITVAIYLATALLYAHNTPGRFGLAADSTLLFGTALVGFGFEMGLVKDMPFGGAYAALAFGAVYVATATWTLRSNKPETRVLGECLIAIGVGFVTLAVPLALDVKWTSAAWALEGLGAFWVGMRQARWMVRAFGMLLVLVASVILLTTIGPNVSAVPLANTAFVGSILIAGPLLALAWWLRKPLPHSGSDLAESYARSEPAMAIPAFLGGFIFASIALIREITRELPPVSTLDPPRLVIPFDMHPLAIAIGLLALMAASAWAGRRFDWDVARWPSRLALPLLAGTLLLTVTSGHHVLEWPYVLLWLVTLALHLDILRREDRAKEPIPRGLSRWIHAATVWLFAAMVADSLQLGIDRAALWETSWSGVTFLVAVTLILLALTGWAGRAAGETRSNFAWPLDPHARAYWWIAAVPLAILAYFGALATAAFAQGITAPLPYIPLLNPVDLSVALALAALLLWRRMVGGAAHRPPDSLALFSPFAPGAATLLGFVAVNAIWLRTAHHWLGVDWSAEALAASPVVQLGLAILWTLMAMALMLFATRRASRVIWILGAALLVLVVAKLLLVDMSSAAGWQRIATFIGVGVLMLVIGYFVPLPPRKAGAEEEK